MSDYVTPRELAAHIKGIDERFDGVDAKLDSILARLDEPRIRWMAAVPITLVTLLSVGLSTLVALLIH